MMSAHAVTRLIPPSTPRAGHRPGLRATPPALLLWLVMLAILPLSACDEGNKVTPRDTGPQVVAGEWLQLASMPTARSDHSAAILGSRVLVTGGRDAGGELAVVEAYDPLTDTWATLAPMNMARIRHGSAAVDGLLYVVGGTDAALTPIASVEAYNPAANTWQPRAPLPLALQGVTARTLAGRIHAIGHSGRMYVYDPALDAWAAGPLSPAYNHSPAAVAGEQLYQFYSGFPDVYRFDPGAASWSGVPSTRESRWWFCAEAVRDRIYVYGGGLGGNPLSPNVEVLDTLTRTWVTAAALPRPASGLACASLYGLVLAFGTPDDAGNATGVWAYVVPGVP